MHKKFYYTFKRLYKTLKTDEVILNSNFVLYNGHYYLLKDVYEKDNKTYAKLVAIADNEVTVDLEEQVRHEKEAAEKIP